MYSESLGTPHPFKANLDLEEYPRPLYEVAEIERLRAGLEDIAMFGEDVYDAAKIEVASSIATHVNRSLWFPVKTYHRDDYAKFYLPDPLPLDVIHEKQMTTCFGYTIVASECLEATGIDHWIGYANGHAFILIPTSDNQVHYLDALVPSLNQNATNAVERGDNTAIASQIEEHGRAAVMLDSRKLGSNINENTDILAQTYPWLKFNGGNNTKDFFAPINYKGVASKYTSQYKLIMSVFDQAKGREVMQEYVSFQCYMSSGNTSAACVSLRNMNGFFPEMDARQSHDELNAIVSKLCITDPDEAIAIVDDYFASNFVLSTDSRVPVAKGDMFRKIARLGQNSEAARMAGEAYGEAIKRPLAFTAAVIGKIASAQTLYDQLK